MHSVVQPSQAPGEAQLVATRHAAAIRSLADFGGRRLGVSGLRPSTQFRSADLGVLNGVRLADMVMVAAGAGERLSRPCGRAR